MRRECGFASWGRAASAGLAAIACILIVAGCDRESDETPADDSGTEKTTAAVDPKPDVHDVSSPEPIDLRNPPESALRQPEYAEPRRVPACRELFEPEGQVRSEFLPDQQQPRLAIYGCDPEAYRRSESGRHYVAYSLSPDRSDARDLRLVAYGSDGDKIWAYRLKRTDQTDSFAADFRESFIAPLPPHLTCVGTLWSRSTSVSCLDHESGEEEWEGELDFWAGIPLRGRETALHTADFTGVTRRYPYSGVEMERTEFLQTGGRSALYETDGNHLFFAPDESPNRLYAYGFESLEMKWRTELPGTPDPGFEEGVLARHDVVVVKVGERLVGFDVGNGRPRWTLVVGEPRPSLAAGPELVYVMVHRKEKATLLVAVEPSDGAIKWWGRVPTGVLEADWVAGGLYVRSVRAFQAVETGG